MNDTVRMTDKERSLELLREIIDVGAQKDEFPEEAAVRARWHNEPWVVDDLTRVKYIGQVNQRLVPTIGGLRAVDTPVAANALQDLRKVFATLRRMYLDKPLHRWTATQATHDGNLDSRSVGRLLLHFTTPTSLLSMFSSDAGGRVTDFIVGQSIMQEDPFAEAPTDAVVPAPDGPIKLTVRDFMGLAQVDFSPEGVCLLVGPNGSGKSSLLQALAFLRDLFQWGIPNAVKFQRGLSGLKRVGADRNAEVILGIGVGDVSWEFRLPIHERSMSPFPGEIVKIGGNILLRRGSDQEDWYIETKRRGSTNAEGRTCLRDAWEMQSPRVLEPLVKTLRSYRLYGSYALDAIRNGGTGNDLDRVLEPHGANLFVVLRNWKTAPREFRHQFEWVLEHARRAFKGIIEDIEFAPPVGQVVPATFFPPGSTTGLFMSRAAEGLLVGLLHLTAVAGAEDGAIIAIEEMENFLHPHAIRAIVAAMREMAEERRLTILLTTHSPLLMNVFRDRPENVFVMEPGRETLPVRLTDLHDPDWLAHFEIGDLYDRMEFGAPARSVGS